MQVIRTSILRHTAYLAIALVAAMSIADAAGNLKFRVEASSSNLTVSVAYADNLRASGFFPNPWQGSPNVNFIGTGPTYDSGAIRIHNSSGTAGTVDDVKVVIGSSTFDLWGSALNVPANGDLILAQTSGGQNFDTSDVSGVYNCTPSGLVPQVTVTVAGAATTYQDTSQVLNTGGIDLAGCPQGTNESQPWTQLGGGLLSSEILGARTTASFQVPYFLCGDAVNCATGNFTETLDEMSVPGRGIPLDLALSYNSLAAFQNSSVGYGWRSSYGMQLSVNSSAGTATVILGNGSNVPFTLTNGTYTAPAWVIATLTQNADGTFIYLEKHTQRQYVFSSNRKLVTEIDRNGYATNLSYNSTGQLTSVTDPAGRSFSLTYGTNGNVATVSDPANRKVTLSYDPSGNLSSVTDVAGGVTSFTYDSSHHVVTMTDPRGGILTNSYDSLARVTSQVDPMNRKTTFTYVAGTTTVTDPNGNQIREHFSNNEAVAITRGYASAQEATWNFGYDPTVLGLTSATDPNGHTASLSLDANANVLSGADSLNHVTNFTYDSLNDLTSITDPLGVATTLTYDSHGNLVSVSRPLTQKGQTQTTTFLYADSTHRGDVTGMTDANGNTWSFSYDSNGDLASATDPLSDKTTYSYDSIGRVTSMVSPNGNVSGGNPAQYTTSYSYNAFGDVTATTDPLGHTSSSIFDADRNLVSYTDPDGNKTQYSYDPDNEATKVARADGTALGNSYDGAGNLTSQTDGNSNTTKFTYDPLNRISSRTDPLNRVTSYAHDGAGNLTGVTNASNATTTFSYDAANELTRMTYANTNTPNVTFTYDAGGRRTAMSDGSGSTTYTYDSLNRLASTVDGSGHTIGYTYDLNNNLISITYPNGKQVSYTFNPANEMTAFSDWLSHGGTFSYDANGNLVTENYPNATKATLTYDAADHLNLIVDTKSGTSFASFAYTRDNAGLLTSTAPTGVGQVNESYTYTGLSQLAGVNTSAYKYDASDNVTQLASVGLTYDAADQLKSATQGGASTSFGFDAQGNRTSATPPVGTATTYSYDQANRLINAVVHIGTGLLAGGYSHSLAVRSDGSVWAWGGNTFGQLGNGTTNNATTPVQVSGLNAVSSVASESYSSLALKNDATLWTWGYNGDGELGNGTYNGSSIPVQVSNLTGVTSIGAGTNHGLAVLSNGLVSAWGLNTYGQLGNGTTATSNTPVQVSGLTNVTAVTGGDNHSIALRSDGTVWAWGANKQGQLGNGSTTPSTTPVQVSNLNNVVAVAAGNNSSYALRSDGTEWAWGDNSMGQLGNTNVGKTSTLPVQVAISGVVKITAGSGLDALAIKSDGTAWGWGNNNQGQLGNGLSCSKTCPTPVQVSNLTGTASIAAAYLHTLASRTDGTVWAWGYNASGQLGNGTTANSSTPVQVSNLSSVQAQVNASYSYNGDGLRVSKTMNGSSESFTWDLVAGPPLLLQDGNTELIYGPQGSPIEQISPSGIPTYLHQDQLGSTRLITDSSSNVAATYTYSAFGSTTSHTGSASTFLQFAGEYDDPETGFYYLRTRYYDSTTGQFASVDAVSPSTREPYAYVNDSPLNGTDPSGLFGPTCAELLAQITALAKQAWGKAQGAARDEANCNWKGAKGHWKSFDQLMSTVDNLVQKYKAKGCPPLEGWIEDLLTCYYERKNCPGPDDTEPWLFSTVPWQPIQPPSTNPVWPPKWIQPTPTWPPKLPWPPQPNPLPIPIFTFGFTF